MPIPCQPCQSVAAKTVELLSQSYKSFSDNNIFDPLAAAAVFGGGFANLWSLNAGPSTQNFSMASAFTSSQNIVPEVWSRNGISKWCSSNKLVHSSFFITSLFLIYLSTPKSHHTLSIKRPNHSFIITYQLLANHVSQDLHDRSFRLHRRSIPP